jgi:light-regulated signal transduction histidine kinase (bacteriophytochrome)
MVMQMIIPEDLERVSAVFRSKPPQELRIEYRIRKFNQIHWLLSIGRRVQTDAGSTSVLAGVTIDVTEQKSAEEELARQAAELARSNTDLQQFSSIASHDLQEPLRNMAICSELLHRNYRHLLDENGQQLLDLISSGARSGQALTRALLSYARAVSSEALELAPVDLNDAFQQAVSQLRTRIAETMASVTSDALPNVTGDKIQLTQLFQNLIENAIKYRSEAPPAIHVSSVARENEWIITVSDNGVGVSEANVERIFRPFQRLLNPSVSGSGLGLATCSRIIERHHGRIWVESHPGQGSTFFFSIPRQQKPDVSCLV